MRICLLGEFRPVMDEGYTNISTNLSNELAKRHEVIELNPWLPFSNSFWYGLSKSCPDVIHYITAPTIFSFWVLRLLEHSWKIFRKVSSGEVC